MCIVSVVFWQLSGCIANLPHVFANAAFGEITASRSCGASLVGGPCLWGKGGEMVIMKVRMTWTCLILKRLKMLHNYIYIILILSFKRYLIYIYPGMPKMIFGIRPSTIGTMISIAISSICLFQGQVFSVYFVWFKFARFTIDLVQDVARHVRVIGATAWHKKDTLLYQGKEKGRTTNWATQIILLLSIESWLVNRDPYFMVYEIILI